MSAYAYEDSATIGSTEYSLPNDSTTLTPITHAAPVSHCWNIFRGNMAAGDHYILRFYEAYESGGTPIENLSRREEWRGAQANEWYEAPPWSVGRGWQVTLQKVTGGDRVFAWSDRSL